MFTGLSNVYTENTNVNFCLFCKASVTSNVLK